MVADVVIGNFSLLGFLCWNANCRYLKQSGGCP